MGIIRTTLQLDSVNRAGFPPFFRRFETGPAANLFHTGRGFPECPSGRRPPNAAAGLYLSHGVNMNFPINPLSAALGAIQSMSAQAAGGASSAASVATGA